MLITHLFLIYYKHTDLDLAKWVYLSNKSLKIFYFITFLVCILFSKFIVTWDLSFKLKNVFKNSEHLDVSVFKS